MPWINSHKSPRLDFVLAALQPHVNFRALCRTFSISAPTGYKWLARYHNTGSAGLLELSRQPHRSPGKFPALWRKQLIALRRSHPTWGVRKLRIGLRADHPKARKIPSLRTMGRWLKAAGLSALQRPRSRPGPQLERPALTIPVHPNDVWTIDFKGWLRTGDGQRCDPLTIRDLASRFLLCVLIVASQSDAAVRRSMSAVFRKYGLPRVIRVDNGAPFAGNGALNLSRLSVWWMRLGIRVEFIRRGKPQDNGAHEQMHRILKAETASPPAANPRAQQRRLDRWRIEYNTLRPHEAIAFRFPAKLYKASPRPFHIPSVLSYPAGWQTRTVRPNGWIKWRGALRFVGRAFAGQRIGLQPTAPHPAEVCNVHLGAMTIGTLHQEDAAGSMRPAMFQSPKNWTAKDRFQKSPVSDVVAK